MILCQLQSRYQAKVPSSRTRAYLHPPPTISVSTARLRSNPRVTIASDCFTIDNSNSKAGPRHTWKLLRLRVPDIQPTSMMIWEVVSEHRHLTRCGRPQQHHRASKSVLMWMLY